jgi:hypothetical protein
MLSNGSSSARDCSRQRRHLWRQVRLLAEDAHKLAQRDSGSVTVLPAAYAMMRY